MVFVEGDVTVLGSVGSGAEIVAGGSIYIYGALRGRALAGAAGDARARIYCQRVEAELVAINSFYKTADDIEDSLRHGPAQAWLEGSTVKSRRCNRSRDTNESEQRKDTIMAKRMVKSGRDFGQGWCRKDDDDGCVGRCPRP